MPIKQIDGVEHEVTGDSEEEIRRQIEDITDKVIWEHPVEPTNPRADHDLCTRIWITN